MTKTTKNDIEFAIKYLRLIAENVMALRGKMTQGEFGKIIGISRTTVSRIENARNFEIVSLFKIAEYYHLHPGDLCMPKQKGPEDMIRELIREELGKQKQNKS